MLIANDKTKMENPSIIPKPILPLYLVHWIFGLGIFEYPLGTPHPNLSLIYSSILIFIYYTMAAITYPELYKLFSKKDAIIPVLILAISQNLLTLTNIIFCRIKSKDLEKARGMTLLIDNLLVDVGIKRNYVKLLKNQVGKLFYGTFILMTLIAVNVTGVFLENTSLRSKIINSILFSYDLLIVFIPESTFINIVRCIQCRFNNLNEVLTNLSNNIKNDIFVKTEKSQKKIVHNVNSYNTYQEPTQLSKINTFKQIHLQLVKLSQEIDNAYGFQILMSVVVALAVITANFYILYQLFVDLKLPRKELYRYSISATIWIVYYVCKVNLFSKVCSECVQEATTTGDIMNRLYDNSNIDENTRAEIRSFNVQLIQKPLQFTACGLINLDYTLVQGMISSITTFLMILIQLHKIPSSIAFRDYDIIPQQ